MDYSIKSIRPQGFKSVAYTNFAMSAHLVFARIFALGSTHVLQNIRCVLQNTFTGCLPLHDGGLAL